MLKALHHRPLFRLWLGQALSSIGDEIYRVGLTWLAIGLIGVDTGYLAAGQAASLMVLSFVGGKWADTWDPMRAMIRTDFVRMLIVLAPVAISFFMPIGLPVLWIVALSLSGLSAFFDPALQSCLPRFSPDLETLRSANGLMSTTIRLARMIGPAIVGLLAAFVPMIHFFTLDAMTFGFSALSVHALTRTQSAEPQVPPPTISPSPGRRTSFYEALLSGFRAINQVPGFRYVMWGRAITGGTWSLAVTMGFALLIHQLTNGNTQAFGFAIASYGLGNFIGALVFGNMRRVRSEYLMYLGYVLLGIGFIGIGLSPSMLWVLMTAPFAGFCGPMNDLAFVDLVQKKFAVGEISRIFRLRMAVETTATLVLMIMSPTLFRNLGVSLTIVLCGLVWMLCGLWGLLHHTPNYGRRATLPR